MEIFLALFTNSPLEQALDLLNGGLGLDFDLRKSGLAHRTLITASHDHKDKYCRQKIYKHNSVQRDCISTD